MWRTEPERPYPRPPSEPQRYYYPQPRPQRMYNQPFYEQRLPQGHPQQTYPPQGYMDSSFAMNPRFDNRPMGYYPQRPYPQERSFAPPAISAPPADYSGYPRSNYDSIDYRSNATAQMDRATAMRRRHEFEVPRKVHVGASQVSPIGYPGRHSYPSTQSIMEPIGQKHGRVTVEQRKDAIPAKTSPPLKEIPVVTPVATPVISTPKKTLESTFSTFIMIADLNEVAAAAEPLAPHASIIPSQDAYLSQGPASTTKKTLKQLQFDRHRFTLTNGESTLNMKLAKAFEPFQEREYFIEDQYEVVDVIPNTCMKGFASLGLGVGVSFIVDADHSWKRFAKPNNVVCFYLKHAYNQFKTRVYLTYRFKDGMEVIDAYFWEEPLIRLPLLFKLDCFVRILYRSNMNSELGCVEFGALGDSRRLYALPGTFEFLDWAKHYFDITTFTKRSPKTVDDILVALSEQLPNVVTVSTQVQGRGFSRDFELIKNTIDEWNEGVEGNVPPLEALIIDSDHKIWPRNQQDHVIPFQNCPNFTRLKHLLKTIHDAYSTDYLAYFQHGMKGEMPSVLEHYEQYMRGLVSEYMSVEGSEYLFKSDK